jgi:hypothetical protein
MTNKMLNRRQARRSELFTRYEDMIMSRPRKSKDRADALTSWQGDHPDWGDERLAKVEQVILKSQNLLEQCYILAEHPPTQGGPLIHDLLIEPYMTDSSAGRIKEAIQMKNGMKQIAVAECIDKDGRVNYRARL